MSVNEVAASGVRNRLEEVQRICENGGEAVPTSAVEIIELSRDVVETKHKNAKLVDRVKDLERELEDGRSVKRLTCVNLVISATLVQTLEAKVNDADAKCAKMLDKAAQTEENSRSCTSSLEALLKA